LMNSDGSTEDVPLCTYGNTFRFFDRSVRTFFLGLGFSFVRFLLKSIIHNYR
jgi:hypothetical protein